MNIVDQVIGELCKTLLPIPEECYLGDPTSTVAVCTLSSIDLLCHLSNPEILNDVAIVGRLLSENKGIDGILKYLYGNQRINTIIVCGKEVWGHRAGHSLFQLHKHGANQNNRIINSISPDPFVTASDLEIKHFQDNITLINLIDETHPHLITEEIQRALSLH